MYLHLFTRDSQGNPYGSFNQELMLESKQYGDDAVLETKCGFDYLAQLDESSLLVITDKFADGNTLPEYKFRHQEITQKINEIRKTVPARYSWQFYVNLAFISVVNFACYVGQVGGRAHMLIPVDKDLHCTQDDFMALIARLSDMVQAEFQGITIRYVCRPRVPGEDTFGHALLVEKLVAS